MIMFLGLWEEINNADFKGGEFALFKNEAGSNVFKMSPQKWIKSTNAIGLGEYQCRADKNGRAAG